MELLSDWNVAQTPGLSEDVAGYLLAALGARVKRIGSPAVNPLLCVLNRKKKPCVSLTGSHTQIVIAGTNTDDVPTGETRVTITPYGLCGPKSANPATDLTLFCASGIARLLTGQVEDPSEPPTNASGEQAAVLGGIAAATAAVLTELGRLRGASSIPIDISLQEVLATVAIQELAQASLNGRARSRLRIGDGNGSTVCILQTSDGYVAISPREEHQWERWVEVMGSPEWTREHRFKNKAGRAANWDEVHAAMSAWSHTLDKHTIADLAQTAHVPSFPLCLPTEHIASPQLEHRGFFEIHQLPNGADASVPTSPYVMTEPATKADSAPLPTLSSDQPLAGLRVLDFSWVIAGPTATRYLAAMGADVVKVEAPGRGDPGRASELHTVLGQGKRAIVLDLKTDAGLEIALDLVSQCDVLIENFATGIMEKFGLDAEKVHARHPGMIYVSASGMGRTGPHAHAVAYGTLLQCYAGFAELNRLPGYAPRVGMAWLDPMCGLLLALATGAGLAHRHRTGKGIHIDFSMVEAMLFTMVGPLLEAQGVDHGIHTFSPEGVFPCKGEDRWVGLSVRTDDEWRSLCSTIGGKADELSTLRAAGRRERKSEIDRIISDWTRDQTPSTVETLCEVIDIPCHQVMSSLDLLEDTHLRERAFWQDTPSGILPGLPWRSAGERLLTNAPNLGEDTEAILSNLLGLSANAIRKLKVSGVLG